MSKLSIKEVADAIENDPRKEPYVVVEDGPWSAFRNGRDVYLSSDDFTHDVQMKVTGDFACTEDKLEYAKELARRLNTFNTVGRRGP